MSNRNSNIVIVGSVILAAGLVAQMMTIRSDKKRAPRTAEAVLPAKTTRAPAAKTAPVAAAAVLPKAASDKDSLVNLIHETKKCFSSEDCDFPNTDPKSYEIAVGQKIKDLLKTYRTDFAKDPKNKTEAENLAREFMALDDQFVQEVSLEMISDLAPSSENLKAVTEGLNGTLDPLLVEQAMAEMKRYMGTSEEPQVQSFLQDLLAQGSVFSSEKAVQGIFPFINSQSYPNYARVAQTLPPESSVGKDLRALLEEYRRLQTGG